MFLWLETIETFLRELVSKKAMKYKLFIPEPENQLGKDLSDGEVRP